MVRVGIAELKAQLSHYLGLTRAGEEVLITDRGIPVARLAPMGDRQSDIPAHLLEMERRGEVRIGTGRLRQIPDSPRPPRVREGYSVVQSLIEERREGR
ncbi:MAG: type II toxin-antitoxin system prevent-host-death family antitoxin [Candidatus Latescibacterota bacterium]